MTTMGDYEEQGRELIYREAEKLKEVPSLFPHTRRAEAQFGCRDWANGVARR